MLRRTLSIDGKPLPPPTTNLKYAHRLAAEIRERIRLESFSLAEYFPANGDVAQPLTVGAQLDDWLAAQRLEASTSAGYSSAIKFWKAAVCDRRGSKLGDRPVRMLKHSDVLTALASRPALTGKTVNNYVSVLRKAMALAVADKAISTNPAEEDKSKLRRLDPYLGGKELDTINRDMIEVITQAKLADQCSNATVNRTLALIRSILRKAVREWQWLDRAPSVRMLKEPTRRVRYLTHEEADRLLAELPPHLRDMAAFSLASGLRAANVTGLCWSAVDLERRMAWVHPDEAKARKAIPVPLNGEAVSILQKQIGRHREVVFTFKGQPVEQLSTAAWYKALNRAGIERFRWHDLRHTWASWHVQSGTPLHVLQELGGWASYTMVQRYAHLAADHLAPWAERLAAVAGNRGTNPAQEPDEKRVAVLSASATR